MRLQSDGKKVRPRLSRTALARRKRSVQDAIRNCGTPLVLATLQDNNRKRKKIVTMQTYRRIHAGTKYSKSKNKEWP